jgi:DNA-binding GntR family transcriptional regulator
MGRVARPVKRSKGAGGEAAYRALRERILSLSLAPGADLEESGLVAALGLSRTPVREAIIRLASEGLVKLTPNRGARVAPISLEEVRAFFEALDLCQRAVTRLAAARRPSGALGRIRAAGRAFEAAARTGDAGAMAETNFDFHMAVAEAAGNPWLARFFGDLLNQGMRLSRLALVYDPPSGRSREQHGRDIVAEHREMVEAVGRGDADAAEAVAARHTSLFRRRVMDFVAENLTAAVAIVGR